MIDQIRWLGHGTFLVQADPIIYINPWRVIRTPFLADAILVSHDHYDHCSIADIRKLRGDHTLIIGNDRVAQQIPNTTILRPWQSMNIGRASIKAIPAYSPNDPRHPKEHGGLGFVISLNYFDIYYAGDTCITPEMDMIHPDIAILPIDGDGTLTPEDAAQVVQKLRPRWVIPSNWGATGEGATRLDAQRFQKLVGGRAQVIMPE
ncbi:MBL fold metallo-hydrolase [Phototrophicus methaneseepsis]|uniref:MBL fold metallo-hydrolase n=1 Tax=Phototrophicus methaneseepsis TaxID=2710758 RepID=A0A7S8E6V5_9CHLR|nr:MBL fold metallo-hydrolase [Phototrophicus methaneseepsis]QPC81460.1 MBL fold metallo-hydrolase [Phototrophicus methaneseepsis]